jgi:hypothetical protein
MAKFTFPIYKANGQVKFETVTASHLKDARKRVTAAHVAKNDELGPPTVEKEYIAEEDGGYIINGFTNKSYSEGYTPFQPQDNFKPSQSYSKQNSSGGDVSFIFDIIEGVVKVTYHTVVFVGWCGVKIVQHIIVPIVSNTCKYIIAPTVKLFIDKVMIPATNLILNGLQHTVKYSTLMAKQGVFKMNRFTHHIVTTSASPYAHPVMKSVDNLILKGVNQLNNVFQVVTNQFLTELVSTQWAV